MRVYLMVVSGLQTLDTYARVLSTMYFICIIIIAYVTKFVSIMQGQSYYYSFQILVSKLYSIHVLQ